jgi:multicomponent Na+:H+ antiporter subunit E
MARYRLMIPLLAATWVLLTADVSLGGLVVGALLGAGITWVVGEHFPWAPGMQEMLRAVPRAFRYAGRFLKALALANLQVAWIVVQPRLPIRPGIIAFRTRHRSDLGVTLLANSITLTPGTLTVDLSTEGDVLYIHALDIRHPDAVRDGIRRDLEDHTLEVFS